MEISSSGIIQVQAVFLAATAESIALSNAWRSTGSLPSVGSVVSELNWPGVNIEASLIWQKGSVKSSAKLRTVSIGIGSASLWPFSIRSLSTMADIVEDVLVLGL